MLNHLEHCLNYPGDHCGDNSNYSDPLANYLDDGASGTRNSKCINTASDDLRKISPKDVMEVYSK